MPWRKTIDCYKLLTICAEDIYYRHKNMLRLVMNIQYENIYSNDDNVNNKLTDLNKQKKDDIETLTSELWAFLNNKWDKSSLTGTTIGIELQLLLHAEQPRAVMNRVTTYFLNYCRDKQRKQSVSPFHYYYHQASSVLQQASINNPGMQYRSSQFGGTYYAFSPYPLDHISPLLLLTANYSEWPIPPSHIEFVNIHEAPIVIDLSRFYWDESTKSEHFGSPYLLPVKDLTQYIFSKFDFNEESLKETKLGLLNDEDDDLETEFPDLRPLPQIMLLNQNELIDLAENLIATWKPAKKQIFLLKFEEGLTLDQIHSKGYKSVQHNVETAVRSIREQWSMWGGALLTRNVNHEDINDNNENDLQTFFYEAIVDACKK